jgi:hypothetical protein
MSVSRPQQSSAAAWTQALRTEQGAAGERLARAIRDHDLVAVGASPGCLSAIAGPIGKSDPRQVDEVALWLWGLLGAASLQEPARRLWGRQTGWFRASGDAPRLYAPELAAREIARQTLDFAVAAADSDIPPFSGSPVSAAAPPPEAEAIGRWLAGAIEGGGLSETARALWEHPDRPPVLNVVRRRGGGLATEYARELSFHTEDPSNQPHPDQ